MVTGNIRIVQVGSLFGGAAIIALVELSKLMGLHGKNSLDRLQQSPEGTDPNAGYVLADNVAFGTCLVGLMGLMVPVAVGLSFFVRSADQLREYSKLTIAGMVSGALMIIPVIAVSLVGSIKALNELIDRKDTLMENGILKGLPIDQMDTEIALQRSIGVAKFCGQIVLFLGMETFGYLLYKAQKKEKVHDMAPFVLLSSTTGFTGVAAVAFVVQALKLGQTQDGGLGLTYDPNGTPEEASDDFVMAFAPALLLAGGLCAILYAVAGSITVWLHIFGIPTAVKITIRIQAVLVSLAALFFYIYFLGTDVLKEGFALSNVVIPMFFVQVLTFNAFVNDAERNVETTVAAGQLSY